MKKYYGIVLATVIFIWICMGTGTMPNVCAEDSSITISGEITSVVLGIYMPFRNRKADLEVKDGKGKKHTIHVGFKTAYVPHRPPAVGEKVSIVCIKQGGRLAGVTVIYK